MLQNNFVSLVTVLALALFVWMGFRVGRARVAHDVPAPATTGHPEFERHFRVQMNTLEALVVFLPSLWLFTLYWGQLVACLLGLIWVGGRVVYMLAYVKDPKTRTVGFGIQGVALIVLLLGVLIGAARMLIVTGGS